MNLVMTLIVTNRPSPLGSIDLRLLPCQEITHPIVKNINSPPFQN